MSGGTYVELEEITEDELLTSADAEDAMAPEELLVRSPDDVVVAPEEDDGMNVDAEVARDDDDREI